MYGSQVTPDLAEDEVEIGVFPRRHRRRAAIPGPPSCRSGTAPNAPGDTGSPYSFSISRRVRRTCGLEAGGVERDREVAFGHLPPHKRVPVVVPQRGMPMRLNARSPPRSPTLRAAPHLGCRCFLWIAVRHRSPGGTRGWNWPFLAKSATQSIRRTPRLPSRASRGIGDHLVDHDAAIHHLGRDTVLVEIGDAVFQASSDGAWHRGDSPIRNRASFISSTWWKVPF